MNLSSRTSLLHDESIDMIVALLTLLLPKENDQEWNNSLLIESWTVMTAICKFLASDLKMVAPKLINDIAAVEQKK